MAKIVDFQCESIKISNFLTMVYASTAFYEENFLSRLTSATFLTRNFKKFGYLTTGVIFGLISIIRNLNRRISPDNRGSTVYDSDLCFSNQQNMNVICIFRINTLL